MHQFTSLRVGSTLLLVNILLGGFAMLPYIKLDSTVPSYSTGPTGALTNLGNLSCDFSITDTFQSEAGFSIEYPHEALVIETQSVNQFSGIQLILPQECLPVSCRNYNQVSIDVFANESHESLKDFIILQFNLTDELVYLDRVQRSWVRKTKTSNIDYLKIRQGVSPRQPEYFVYMNDYVLRISSPHFTKVPPYQPPCFEVLTVMKRLVNSIE